MEESDPIESKFRRGLKDYEKDPPERVWDLLNKEMHPESGPVSFWTRISVFFHIPKWPMGFYLGLGGTVIGLTLTVAYFGSGEHHAIRGHAYAGEVRLRGGSAELFQVADKTMPWDSVTHCRSSIIDNSGHYQFSRIEAGKYLLRIAPVANSEESRKFVPSWFDQHETSDSSNLIIIDGKDVNADAHLIRNTGMMK